MDGKPINASLLAVQRDLKVPKNQHNSFGKYNYRSCEDILEAATPICIENGAILTCDTEVRLVGARFYIEATARLTDIATGDSIACKGYAREPETKKGMDESQITGTAESYAKKRALGNLFSIDDTKDADTDEHHNQTHNAKITKNQVLAMRICCKKHGMPESKIYEMYNKKSLEDMTVQDFESFKASGKKIVAAWDKENENKGNTE